MKLSDLQNKYIVNILDGKNIGNIIDVNIEAGTGKIISLIIEPDKNFFTFSKKKIDTEICWESITKIGEDVILVKLNI